MLQDDAHRAWHANVRRAIAIPTAAIQCVTMVAMLGILYLFLWVATQAAQWKERYKSVIMDQLRLVDSAIEARKTTDATFMLDSIGLYIQEHAPDDLELLSEFRNRVELLIMEGTKENDNDASSSESSGQPRVSD